MSVIADFKTAQLIDLPSHSLLQKYKDSCDYTDCFVAHIDAHIPHADFVEAFFTTPIFRLERFILHLFVSKPSTNLQAAQLAIGTRENFAAWHLEMRQTDQILMCDFLEKTRAWLMVEHFTSNQGEEATRLYFGSAVIKKTKSNTQGSGNAQKKMPLVFQPLLPFHLAYASMLLNAATARLLKRKNSPIE